ncbi:MAG: uncharacterized protein H6R04_1756 [Burkholderiaceae bacterium]|nr:uncharacterized protein [Burkholderiaceae bacterium]
MKLLQTIKRNYLELLPPAIFFLIAFSLILVTKRLVLSQYGISWAGFGSAVVGAFMVAKVVVVVDKLPFTHKFSDRKLIYIAFWKSLIYLLAALLVQYLERIIPLLRKLGSFAAANQSFLAETIWPHFWLIQIWLVVLLLVFSAQRELIRAIGRDKVMQMFFGARNNQAEK